MYDAVDLAESLIEQGLCVTCIPVINDDLEEDVAVVGLEPNVLAMRALHNPDEDKRVRFLVAVAIHSHRLLPSRGLSFRCPSSS